MVTMNYDGATIRMGKRTLIPLVHEAEEGGYWAEIPELPGCVSQGETIPELFTNLVEAFEAVQAAESSAVVVMSTISPDTTRVKWDPPPKMTTGTA